MVSFILITRGDYHRGRSSIRDAGSSIYGVVGQSRTVCKINVNMFISLTTRQQRESRWQAGRPRYIFLQEESVF
jgi:hypothetical protein